MCVSFVIVTVFLIVSNTVETFSTGLIGMIWTVTEIACHCVTHVCINLSTILVKLKEPRGEICRNFTAFATLYSAAQRLRLNGSE